MQIRENAVRENKNIEVEHVSRDINPADIFSQEDKNVSHYTDLQDNMTPLPFPSINTNVPSQSPIVNTTSVTHGNENSLQSPHSAPQQIFIQ